MAKNMIVISKIWQWRVVYIASMMVLGGVYLYSANMERELDAFIIHEANLSGLRVQAIRDAAKIRGGTPLARPDKFKVNPGF